MDLRVAMVSGFSREATPKELILLAALPTCPLEARPSTTSLFFSRSSS